jgi:hypothetical protein
MSNAQMRLDIAAAANTVDGVHIHPVKAAAPGPGDGWVRWRGAERADGHAYMQTWQVLIVVASDEAKADESVDRLAVDLADALEDVLFIDSFTAVAIPTSAGPLSGLEIIGRSE